MTLAEEAQRYLAVVDAFRAEGREPHWRPESRDGQVQPKTFVPHPLDTVQGRTKRWAQ